MSFSFSSRAMLNSSITRGFGLHLSDKIVRRGATAAIAFTTPAEPKSGAGAGDPSTPVRTSPARSHKSGQGGARAIQQRRIDPALELPLSLGVVI